MGNAHWHESQEKALITALHEQKKASRQSGQGFKPSSFDAVAKTVTAVYPKEPLNACQVKTKVKYFKKPFTKYQFVQGKSSVSFNDNTGIASDNTAEFVEGFLLTYGKDKYAKCFRQPCPFWRDLCEIYNGGSDRAMGEHVMHFGNGPAHTILDDISTRAASKSNHLQRVLASPPSTVTISDNKVPMANSTPGSPSPKPAKAAKDKPSSRPKEKSKGKGKKGSVKETKHDQSFDDELSIARSSGKCTCADTDDEEDDFLATTSRRRRQSSQLDVAKSITALSIAIAKPMSDDLSHVDQVMKILKDKTLLPPDPHGHFFAAATNALCRKPAIACAFFIEDDPVCRRGIVTGLLLAAGISVPEPEQIN
ncbi:unnamed protein product [Mycena citricolor]|uniref:Myb/SANT-like domain-containing protein n=1 Tax=Mycena citricolor TaxID=2018698 RepID=A0AAD2Q2B5_9AGAR|nr:unnamed protein product [Mycena citricolor]